MPTNYRIPRGYAVRHPQYQEIMEGQRPTIKDLTAAPFLPVAEIEPRHDDPIVIPAGTWVGIVGADGASAYDTGSLTSLARYLVPACAEAYTLTYTSNDISDTFGTNGYVLDLDAWDAVARTGSAVTAAGASSMKVGTGSVGVKPIGIVFQDVYASWLADAHVNYERQPNISLLTRDYVVQVPAITENEKAIQPGELVMMDGYGDTSMTWNPGTSNTGAMRVGHLISLHDQSAALTNITGNAAQGQFAARISDYVVGRCLRKILVAEYSSATINTTLSANVSSLSRSNVSTEFADAGRVQTVPGLSLQGSGLKGVPAWARTATADSAGRFWVLEIHVGVC